MRRPRPVCEIRSAMPRRRARHDAGVARDRRLRRKNRTCRALCVGSSGPSSAYAIESAACDWPDQPKAARERSWRSLESRSLALLALPASARRCAATGIQVDHAGRQGGLRREAGAGRDEGRKIEPPPRKDGRDAAHAARRRRARSSKAGSAPRRRSRGVEPAQRRRRAQAVTGRPRRRSKAARNRCRASASGIAGGGSRLTEAYFARQKALEDAVDAQRAETSAAGGATPASGGTPLQRIRLNQSSDSSAAATREQRRERREERRDLGFLLLEHEARVERLVDLLQVDRVARVEVFALRDVRRSSSATPRRGARASTSLRSP